MEITGREVIDLISLCGQAGGARYNTRNLLSGDAPRLYKHNWMIKALFMDVSFVCTDLNQELYEYHHTGESNEIFCRDWWRDRRVPIWEVHVKM